ncbi:MAG TPA: hypothetical protein VGM24_13080, partial [Puia sp.]
LTMKFFLPAGLLMVFSFIGPSRTTAQSAEPWKPYRVQPSHPYFLQSRKLLNSKKKIELGNNIADFYLYRNGELVKPPKNGHYDFFPAGCLCFKYDDTLLLNSGVGASVGVGVGIKIYSGMFTSSLHANNKNRQIYKLSEEDSVYQESILAEPETQSLKLLRQPDFVPNEVIIGEYRATYKKFYRKNARSRDEACRYTVRIVFKCRVTGGIDSMKSLTGMNTQ